MLEGRVPDALPLQTIPSLQGLCLGYDVVKSEYEEEESQWYWETGGILFREYCFGRENSVNSVKNSVSLRWHTNNRLRGTH